MKPEIEPYNGNHLDAVVDLSLRAWAPVFPEIEAAMDPEVYHFFFPDWRVEQSNAVKGVCESEDAHVHVALVDGAVAGFVAIKLDDESQMGEIYMIAVDPDYQRQGVGAALNQFALDWMRDNGMAVAMVETGGDPGHEPARRSYERAGFRVMPVARYFKKL